MEINNNLIQNYVDHKYMNDRIAFLEKKFATCDPITKTVEINQKRIDEVSIKDIMMDVNRGTPIFINDGENSCIIKNNTDLDSLGLILGRLSGEKNTTSTNLTICNLYQRGFAEVSLSLSDIFAKNKYTPSVINDSYKKKSLFYDYPTKTIIYHIYFDLRSGIQLTDKTIEIFAKLNTTLEKDNIETRYNIS